MFARPGFWSAVLTAVFSILFVVGFILNAMGLLPPPWEAVIPIGASLLLALSFVVMMVAVHYAAPSEKTLRQVARLRKAFQMVLWATAHLYLALGSLLSLLWLISRLRSRERG